MAFPSHIKRIDKLSEKDKLWELYLHTLAGWHGSPDVELSNKSIASSALKSAEQALKVWNDNE